MSKTKKSHKSSDSNSETSDETSSSSSEAAEELKQKREKKKRKQKDKKKKKHKKVKTAKKKSKQNSEAEEDKDNSASSTDSSSSSEEEKTVAKKKLKKLDIKSPSKIKREGSRSRDREKHGNKSKWESPSRKARSRSRERYRNDRSRSRDKLRSDRSRSRNRDRSQERNRERNTERYRSSRDYRSEVKKEEDVRRNHKPRDREDQGGSYDRRDRSPKRERDRSRDRNRDRDYVKREPRSPNRSRGTRNRFKNQRNEDDGNSYEWGKSDDKKTDNALEAKEKEKPNFALSGALTEDANKVNGVVVKYAEPPEARKPKRRWRLYPFKGETALPVLHIHRQSCFLVGRDRKVVDLAVDHPSCSKQHAALQYRLVPFERENGTQGKRVRLYLIDLDSANGTFLNNKRIDAKKYYELMEKDVVKFGFSTREYVLLHENSKEDQEDDDIEVKEEPTDN